MYELARRECSVDGLDEYLVGASAITTEHIAVVALDLAWTHNSRNRAAGTGGEVCAPCEPRELRVVPLPPLCTIVLAAVTVMLRTP
jgi:hypothetical protein